MGHRNGCFVFDILSLYNNAETISTSACRDELTSSAVSGGHLCLDDDDGNAKTSMQNTEDPTSPRRPPPGNISPNAASSSYQRLAEMFRDSALMKLGFGFRDDIKMLRKSFAHVSNCAAFPLEVHRFLDLESLCVKDTATKAFLKLRGANTTLVEPTRPQAHDRHGTSLVEEGLQESRSPHEEAAVVVVAAAPNPFSVSLSSLVEATLRFHMDKSHRMSNWEARPLSKAQLQYAALDAISLVRIYDQLQSEVEGFDAAVPKFVKSLTS
jgi:hypothetical protein